MRFVAISALLGFWGLAALLIIVPGPDWAFAINAGLRGHVLPAATGIVLGYLVVTAVVAAGVGALVASSPVVLTTLIVVGGGYLIWLGSITLVQPAALPGVENPAPVRCTVRSTIAKGVGVSGLNPKALLVFVAMLPQFTNPSARWPIAGQLGALGLVFTLTCAVVYLVVGTCARRVLRSSPKVARVVSRTSAVCMLIVGAALLAERFLSSSGG